MSIAIEGIYFLRQQKKISWKFYFEEKSIQGPQSF